MVTLSGTIMRVDAKLVDHCTLFVQPWAYRINVDSCKIASDGNFKVMLRRGRTYTFVFDVSTDDQYVKTFYINENSAVSVLLPSSATQTPTINFIDNKSYSARINDAGDKLIRQIDLYRDHKNNVSDWRNYQHVYDSLKSINADSIAIQQYLLSQICNLRFTSFYNPKDSALIVDLFEKVPPSTPLWSYLSSIVFIIAEYTNSFEYVEKVINSQPDPWTRGWLMLYYLPAGASKGDSIRVRNYARTIVDEFSGTQMAVMAKPFVNQEAGDQNFDLRMARLTVGMQLPKFNFPLFGDTSKTISNDNLLGKKYLLSFWATWCRPCIEQMPYLDSVYKKYHSKGLELLSVSLDNDLNKVQSFQTKSYAMPWLNAFAPGEFDNKFIKSLGIAGVPVEFLVDSKGVILATTNDLIKWKLDRTIANILKTN